MRADVAERLSWSAAVFKRTVWPAIAPHIGGGEIEPVESVTAEGFRKNLDVLSGIDAWQIVSDVGIRGVASRVQQGDRDWQTFTVRRRLPSGRDTEWHKVQRAHSALEQGFIRAHLIVQAYVSDGGERLLGAYVVRAPDLYRLCCEGLRGAATRGGQVKDGAWYPRTVKPSGEEFAAFPVEELRRRGVRVKQVRPEWRLDA